MLYRFRVVSWKSLSVFLRLQQINRFIVVLHVRLFTYTAMTHVCKIFLIIVILTKSRERCYSSNTAMNIAYIYLYMCVIPRATYNEMCKWKYELMATALCNVPCQNQFTISSCSSMRALFFLNFSWDSKDLIFNRRSIFIYGWTVEQTNKQTLHSQTHKRYTAYQSAWM